MSYHKPLCRNLIAFAVALLLVACGDSSTKQKELELKEKEIELKTQELALKTAAAAAPAPVAATPVAAAASIAVAPALPFVGKRDFNFMGGSSTGSTIQITNDASVLIKSCGVTACTTDYRGSFKPLIPDGNGGYYKFTASKVYWLDRFKKPNTGCTGEEAEPCITDLYR